MASVGNSKGMVRRGSLFKGIARRVNPSTKKVKTQADGVFGPSSQFAGVGRGVRGDVRK